jgi:hypothetical protein
MISSLISSNFSYLQNKRYQQQMLSIRNATEGKKCKNYHMTGNKEIFNANKIIVSIRKWKFMYK